MQKLRVVSYWLVSDPSNIFILILTVVIIVSDKLFVELQIKQCVSPIGLEVILAVSPLVTNALFHIIPPSPEY